MDQLRGITAQDWLKLLRENHFDIAPRYTARAAFLTIKGLVNSYGRLREIKKYREAYEQVEVEAPLFVIGHWRNGTTMLHYLLSQDQRFSYPTIFQTFHPHTFLSQEDGVYAQVERLSPRGRPMDNVTFKPTSPGEDEFAISATSLRSPLLGWSFTKREQYYDQFLTFRGVPEADIDLWKTAFITFLKKITWKLKRPLLLKSPTHTCRIRLLLEMFPKARFVHIRRDPYTVFRSTQLLFKKGIPRGYLQTPPSDEAIDAGILRRYNQMYEAFFDEIKLIPDGQFCEVYFEELEEDKIGNVRTIYEQLGLSGFREVQPAIEKYIASIDGYKKNRHEPLPDHLREQVAQACRRNFEDWGYDLKDGRLRSPTISARIRSI